MLEPEIILKTLKKTLSGGGSYADLFIEGKTPAYILLEENKIEKIVSGSDSGAGLRLIFGGKTSYAYSNEISEGALLEMAETLSKASFAGGPGVEFDLRKRRPEREFPIKTPPDSVPMERKIWMLSDANRAVRGLDGRIRQISIMYADSLQRVIVASSEGAFSEDERVHTVCVVNVIAEEDGLIQTGLEAVGGHAGFELFEESPAEDIALKAARRALGMLRARRAPGGRMPVVISSEAGGTMIHEAIGHGLEADLAGQGLSVYSGMLGKQIASPLITVIDSAVLPGKRGSYRFDDEGTPSQATVLVKDGVLVSYMYDKASALKDGVSSTGNGRRESYRHRPIPRMTNTYIQRGNTPPEDALRLTPSGLFVKKMGGGQVNTVTGEFVFDVQEGHLIENGRIGEPVRGATLVGNGPEALKAVDIVCTDMGFSIGTCGKDSQGVPVSDAMPTIRLPEMVVGGEV